MKRILALLLSLLLTASLMACGGETQPAQTAEPTVPQPTESPEEAKVLKILTIGNSHSSDANQLLYEVFQDQAPEQEVVIGTLYYSGCSIAKHVGFASGNQPVYELSINSDGTWVRTKDVTMEYGLRFQAWDIVVIQEVFAGNEAVFLNDNRQKLVDYVNQHIRHPHTFVWNMDIVCPNDETFYSPTYDPQPPANFRAQQTAIHGFDPVNDLKLTQANVVKYILPDETYTNYIPSGTVVMYAYLVDGWTQPELYRDYIHVTDFGRLLVSYMWYAQLTGQPLTEVHLDSIDASLRHRRAIALGDMAVTQEMKQTIINAVNHCLENPWTVPGESS